MTTRLADAYLAVAGAVVLAMVAPWWAALAGVAVAGALVHRAARNPHRR